MFGVMVSHELSSDGSFRRGHEGNHAPHLEPSQTRRSSKPHNHEMQNLSTRKLEYRAYLEGRGT